MNSLRLAALIETIVQALSQVIVMEVVDGTSGVQAMVKVRQGLRFAGFGFERTKW